MLTDKPCKSVACQAYKKCARVTDALGFYLEVSPAGSKRWFWKTYADGKGGRVTLGSYLAGGLVDARKARGAAKIQKTAGVDAVQARKVQKLKGILPQTPGKPSRWIKDFTGERRDAWLHRFGNLMLLSRCKNIFLGNLDDADERVRNFEGRVESLPNLQRLLAKTAFALTDLEARHKELLDRLAGPMEPSRDQRKMRVWCSHG